MQIRKVQLEDVYPSETNPRNIDPKSDDIAELASTLIGGVPVTPIIVVSDGGIYHIVDGERRYHAMVSLGTTECDAIVADDMEDADTVVAMLATNNKEELTDDEKAAGVQQALLLGVDYDMTAKASKLDPELVKKYKKVLPKVRKAEEERPRMLTIEEGAMLSDFDESKQDELLKHPEHIWWEHGKLERKMKAEANAPISRQEIIDSGATLYTSEEYDNIGYDERCLSKDGTNWGKPITSKGCGCDGFSGYVNSEGDAVYFCTHPENHKKVDEDETEEDRERREADERFSESVNKQIAFVLDTVRRGMPALFKSWAEDEYCFDYSTETAFNRMNTKDDIAPTFLNMLILQAVDGITDSRSLTLNPGYSCAYTDSFLRLSGALKVVGYEFTEDELAYIDEAQKVIVSREAEHEEASDDEDED